MDNKVRNELPLGAFQIWMGQWQLTTLDTDGCMFVLSFLLRAFRCRQPEDKFWDFLERFLFAEDHSEPSVEDEDGVRSAQNLLAYAGTLPPEQARALMAYLSECYSTEEDRGFWMTVSEAIQLYTVAPYGGRSAGNA